MSPSSTAVSSRSLSRRLISAANHPSSRKYSYPGHLLHAAKPVPYSTARSFTISAQQLAPRTPSLSDVSPSGAKAFDAKQKEFRNNLAAAKRAESQSNADSPSSSPPSASSSSSSSSFSSSSLFKSNVDGNPDDGPVARMGLGSLSTHSSGEAREDTNNEGKRKGALSSLIYGTEEGRQMDQDIERSFSETLARGKYVHSIVLHEVKPDRVDDYVQLVGGWYPKVAKDPKNKVNLVGSWRTEVGDCDTFVHIWEYQRYHGYHDSLHSIQHGAEFSEFDHQLKSMINSKKTSLMQEFSFWPTSPPRQLGGVFELRSYTLNPGNLLEWETHWRKGLEARREVMEGVGAWFVQIGELNTVHHLWQFANLEERKIRREKSWSIEGWGDTVHKTVPLIQSMKSRILIPMPWSPVS